MSLRSSLTKLVGSLPSLRLGTTWASAPVVVGFMVAAAIGCGGCDDNSLVCDPSGLNCKICDAYGCRPANPDGSGGSGGGGGATAGTGGKSVTSGTSGTSSTGGSTSCDPTKATCPCDAQNKCPDGKQCVQGLCISGCNYSYECGPGKVCADGACTPGCDSTKPCNAGYVCTKGACAVDPSNPACGASNPCPTGEICGTNGQCTTSCTADSQCAEGEVCDGATQQCIPDPAPKPLCNASTPCPSPEVCQADGYCHYPCSSVSQCKLIDNRFVACSQGVCKTDEEVNPQCSLTKPCPTGKNCISNLCK